MKSIIIIIIIIIRQIIFWRKYDKFEEMKRVIQQKIGSKIHICYLSFLIIIFKNKFNKNHFYAINF